MQILDEINEGYICSLPGVLIARVFRQHSYVAHVIGLQSLFCAVGNIRCELVCDVQSCWAAQLLLCSALPIKIELLLSCYCMHESLLIVPEGVNGVSATITAKFR
jgi:hypothetical protein